MYTIFHWCEYHLDNGIVFGGKGWRAQYVGSLTKKSSIAPVVTIFPKV